MIFSERVRSRMFGAMYLHRPIPGIHREDDPPDFTLNIRKLGTREGYARNVYGDPTADCSWDVIEKGETPAWDLSAAYADLWDKYEHDIANMRFGPNNIGALIANFPCVLCTIPATALCARGHSFRRQSIWVAHKPTPDYQTHEMIYNGAEVEPWYRYSRIRGYEAWEFSRTPVGRFDLLLNELSQGQKPLSNNCNCWTGYDGFHQLGRYGKWEKGVLTHHAYEEAKEIANALQ